MPAPAVRSLQQRSARVRGERNTRLDESDRLAMRYVGDGEPVPEPIKAYRQALRDVPEQPGFPESITWPTPPES